MLTATALWLAVKAWLLPFLGPIAARAGILAAGARSRIPAGAGAFFGLMLLAGVFGALLWWRAGAWLNPPPRTYTAAEIEAATYKAKSRAQAQAIAEQQAALERRDTSINHLAEIVEATTKELEDARSRTRNPDAVAVESDDPWLREWHRRGW